MADNTINIKVKIDDKGNLSVLGKKAKAAGEGLERTAKSAQTADRNLKGAARTSSNSTKNFSKMAQGISGGLVPAYATLAAQVFAVTAAFQFFQSAFDFTNDKYTIPSGQGGKYFVYSHLKNAASATRRLQLGLYKNGSLLRAAPYNVDYYAGGHLGVAVELSAADYIEIYCKIDNGGGGMVLTDTESERFGAYKIIE